MKLQNEGSLVRIFLKTHMVDSLMLTLQHCLHQKNSGLNDITGAPEMILIVDDITEILCWIINNLIASTQQEASMVCFLKFFSYGNVIVIIMFD